MENKYYFIIAGAVVLILLAVGIILSVRGGRRQDKEKPADEPVTITVWRLFDNEEVLKPIFDQYRSERPNVTIVYEKKNPAEYEAEFTNAIAAGKGPDILSLPNDWMVKHRDKLVPAPESLITVEKYREQFVNVVVEEGLFENRIYGMPLYVDALVLYYNSELMLETLTRLRQSNPAADWTKEAQLLTRPPSNWDDLVAAVKLIRQVNGANVALSGLAMGTAETTQNAAAILAALMLQNGAEMTNVDKTAASFHLPDKKQTGDPYYPGTEALDFYTAFALANRAVYNWNDKLGSSLDAFMNKKAAMMINFQYVQHDIKQKAPTLFYDIAPLPQIKGSTSPVNVASYMMETVTKNSAHPDIAWDFIKFLTDPSRASMYRSATRRPPALRSLVENETGAMMGVRIAKAVYKPDAPKYDSLFREMIRAVVDLRQPPQAAIEVAANKVTELLLGK